MYADNTLTPKESVRLCALGTLALAPMRYSGLASASRHFVGHILGPSLDLMGSSLELLKFEGLIEAIDGQGMEDDAVLAISVAGRNELRNLLTANIRVGATELNKLVFALKFRFLHLLSHEDQQSVADQMIDVLDSELIRLGNLREYGSDNEGFLTEWLDHDIELTNTRLGWLCGFRDRIKTG